MSNSNKRRIQTKNDVDKIKAATPSVPRKKTAANVNKEISTKLLCELLTEWNIGKNISTSTKASPLDAIVTLPLEKEVKTLFEEHNTIIIQLKSDKVILESCVEEMVQMTGNLPERITEEESAVLDLSHVTQGIKTFICDMQSKVQQFEIVTQDYNKSLDELNEFMGDCGDQVSIHTTKENHNGEIRSETALDKNENVLLSKKVSEKIAKLKQRERHENQAKSDKHVDKIIKSLRQSTEFLNSVKLQQTLQKSNSELQVINNNLEVDLKGTHKKLQNSEQQLKSENNALTKANKSLEVELEIARKEYKEYSALQVTYNTLLKSQTKWREERSYFKKSCAQLEAECSQNVTLVEHLQRKIEDLSSRLSEEMSTKVGRDESSLENISIQNRPINIKDEYENLCSSTWLHAKEKLDKTMKNEPEQKRVEFLVDIMTTSSAKAANWHSTVWSQLGMLLMEPILFASYSKEKLEPDHLESLPDVIKGQLGDWLRTNCDKVAFGELLNAILDEILNKKWKSYSKTINENEVKTYVKECALLGWKMATQRPQMYLRTPATEAWVNNRLEPAWGSTQPNEKSSVVYYTYPMLLHGDKLMVKGKALII